MYGMGKEEKSLAESLPDAHRALAGYNQRGSNAHLCREPAVLLVGSVLVGSSL